MSRPDEPAPDVAAYQQRAVFYPAEIADIPVPVALARLLTPGCAVAEMPSGTGHFLPAYTGGTQVTLIDASEAMLRHTRAFPVTEPAVSALPVPESVRARLEELPALRPDLCGSQDLVIVPNGALNQLAASVSVSAVLETARFLLQPRGHLLLQAMLWNGPVLDACGIYHPNDPHGQWRTDRCLSPSPAFEAALPGGQAGGPVMRRRRVHHPAPPGSSLGDSAALVRIDVELYQGPNLLHSQTVQLAPFARPQLRRLLDESGWDVQEITAGGNRLTEIVATPARAAAAGPVVAQADRAVAGAS